MNGNSLGTPFTNRGVENTSALVLKRCIICDWCQFTVFYFGDTDLYRKSLVLDIKRYAISLFKKLFNLEDKDLYFEDFGINGYSHSVSYKNIYCYYSLDRVDMGVNFKLSGRGCRDFEDLGLSWLDLFKELRKYDINYNRIDIAIDDFTDDYFDISKLQKYVRRGQVRSKFKFSIDMIKRQIEDGKIVGNTLQFGSKASDLQITFYDKMLERQSQDYIVDNNIKNWTRCELRFRHEKAREIVNLIADNVKISATIFSILASYITFCEKSNDKNKSRWKVADFWQRYIGRTEKVKLAVYNVEAEISKKKNWLDRTINRSQFMVVAALLDDIDADSVTLKYIRDLLEDGCKKITDKDLFVINDYRQKQGLKSVTREHLYNFVKAIKNVVAEK